MVQRFCPKESDIILDFFSGSATTAHAVMQLNAEDGGNRKFIMVQLPEETPEDSEARKAGYNTIPDIAKERIRRAGKKIKEESPLTTADLDTGFRVFRLDEGNYEDVNRSPKEFKQDQLDLFLNNIKTDRNDLDLLFGCMLDWGVQPSAYDPGGGGWQNHLYRERRRPRGLLCRERIRRCSQGHGRKDAFACHFP